MLNFKKLFTKEKKHCQRCKSTEHLHINSRYTNKDGVEKISYMCKNCTAERINKYYHAGNQDKFKAANQRYQAKKKLQKA